MGKDELSPQANENLLEDLDQTQGDLVITGFGDLGIWGSRVRGLWI